MAGSCDQHVVASLQDAAHRTTGPEQKIRSSYNKEKIMKTLFLCFCFCDLLPRSHRCNTGQYRGFSDLPAESSAYPFDVTGDSVGRDVQRLRNYILHLYSVK